jgi:hypothetical protein
LLFRQRSSNQIISFCSNKTCSTNQIRGTGIVVQPNNFFKVSDNPMLANDSRAATWYPAVIEKIDISGDGCSNLEGSTESYLQRIELLHCGYNDSVAHVWNKAHHDLHHHQLNVLVRTKPV